MAVEFLQELNVPFFKVGSGDTNNFPYLVKTAKKGERELSYLGKCFKNHSMYFILNTQVLKQSQFIILSIKTSSVHLKKLYPVIYTRTVVHINRYSIQ